MERDTNHPISYVPHDAGIIGDLKRGGSEDIHGYINRAFELQRKLDTPEKKNFRSHFEATVNLFLQEARIENIYELFSFKLYDSGGRSFTYTPDFVTDLFIDNRRVLIEPHGIKYLTSNEVRKFKLFVDSYSWKYYLILIIDEEDEKKVKRQINNVAMFGGKVADDIWYVGYNMGASNKESCENELFRLRLAELKIRSKKNCTDPTAMRDSI